MSYNTIKEISNKSIHLGVIAVIIIVISATILVPQVQGSIFFKSSEENISHKISNYIDSFVGEGANLIKYKNFEATAINQIIQKIISEDKFNSIFSDENDFIKKLFTSSDSPITSEVTIQKFIGFLNLLITLPIILLKGIITGGISIISGLIRTVMAIIKLTILSVAGIQGALTFTGFFIIFLGLMTKLGFKIFSIISSPIFSVIVLRIIPALGSLFGGLSLIIHSIIGLAIMSALPLLIIILAINIVKIVQGIIEDGLPTS